MDAAELAFAGPLRQAELIRDGEISPRELVQVYLDRIERIEPELNAFRIVLAERALTEAKQAGRRKASQERPLLGVPFAVKDNHDLTGEVTTHGTGAYDRTPAKEDAEIVQPAPRRRRDPDRQDAPARARDLRRSPSPPPGA